MNNNTKLIKTAAYIVFIIFLFLIPIFTAQGYFMHVLIIIGINIILASSLRLITCTGQFSLAHVGIMAIGGYLSALLATKLNLPFWITFPIAGIAAALLGLIIGYPFVRVKKVYFAMLTLFTSEVIRNVIIEFKDLTGGATGLMHIPPPNPIVFLGLINIDFTSKVSYYYLVLITLLITLIFLYRIEVTRTGAMFRAIQQGDSIPESIGINTTNYKVLALVIGFFFAGIAGSLSAHYYTVLSPSSFTILQSVYILVYVIVGGRKSFSGAILGAFILTVIPEIFRTFKEYQPIIFVAILFLIIFFQPQGLYGLCAKAGSYISRIWKRRVAHA